jgi:hypothetical protein
MSNKASSAVSRSLLSTFPLAIALLGSAAVAAEPKTVSGLKNPESAPTGRSTLPSSANEIRKATGPLRSSSHRERSRPSPPAWTTRTAWPSWTARCTSFSQGYLFRLDLKTKKLERIGSGFGGTDGLARDAGGRRFVGDWKNGKLFELVSENEPPRLLSDIFQPAADISLMPDGKTLFVPDMKRGTLTWFPVR